MAYKIKTILKKYTELGTQIMTEQREFDKKYAEFFKAKKEFDAHIADLEDKQDQFYEMVCEQGQEIIKTFLYLGTVNDIVDLEKYGFDLQLQRPSANENIWFGDMEDSFVFTDFSDEFIFLEFEAIDSQGNFIGDGTIGVPLKYFDLENVDKFAKEAEKKFLSEEQKKERELNSKDNRIKRIQEQIDSLQKQIDEINKEV